MKPRHPRSLLPPVASKLLDHFRSTIELSTEEVAQRMRNSTLPVPYWDPTLRRSRAKRRHLLLHLARCGLVSFRRRVKARCGVFFVKKKVGSDGVEWIRLVLDARQACFLHRHPPKVYLGSARAMAEVDMSEEALGSCGGTGGVVDSSVFAAGADVDDSFYNFCVPELASWFGLDETFSGAELLEMGFSRVWDDDAGGEVKVLPHIVYTAVFEGLSMGWSWSLYICQQGFEHQAALQPPRRSGHVPGAASCTAPFAAAPGDGHVRGQFQRVRACAGLLVDGGDRFLRQAEAERHWHPWRGGWRPLL